MARIQLQASDVVAAQRLHVRLSPLRLILYAVVVVVLLIGVDLLISRRLSEALYPALAAAGITVVVLLAAMYFLYLPWIGRRMYRQQKMMRDASELEWDERCVTIRSAAAHSTIAWEDYVKWKENDRLFLIYLADRLFQVIPKSAFASAGEEQDFRRHLPRIGASLRSGRPA